MSQWDMLDHYGSFHKPLRHPDDPLVDANDVAVPEDEVEFWASMPSGRQEDDEGSG